jgi:hypothetical protein
MGMKRGIAFIREHRERTVGDVPIDIGTITGPIDVSGDPEEVAAGLRRFGAVGVDQLQVSFRARSVEDLCDQIETFGRDVGPLLND